MHKLHRSYPQVCVNKGGWAEYKMCTTATTCSQPIFFASKSTVFLYTPALVLYTATTGLYKFVTSLCSQVRFVFKALEGKSSTLYTSSTGLIATTTSLYNIYISAPVGIKE